ncbi:NF038122 family metalloprotease [Bradyrhizobium sp. Ash2021]|uniref:NF038122 family metalloprotease n=1 Tax=Bradyrhizobium sp. Ash2021 TaxID=2954771 RepID=UPI002814C401|nr:NF038122 family metalloprotease [Bradyrhizobium sp. Ash2021]WMT72578.1 NF038122 family metalloprotease [Bradyrhizobium sp. Ash2021]
MKSRFITDPQDPSDSFLYTAGAEIYTRFSSPAGHDGGKPPASTPVEIPSTPALTSEAVESLGAQSGATTTVSLTGGGITINLLYDAAAMAAPASFRAGIQQAAAILTSTISDQITVNIKIDYSGTGGGAAAGPDNGLYESYSSVRADLVNNATPGDTTFNALPSGSSIQGQSNVAVWNAQLKLWGLLGANDTATDDGSATFATDINSNLLVGVALHELTHAMGRVPYGSPYSTSPDIFDLFRFTSPGVRMFNGASTASAAYFSVDGGNTKLADFGQTSDPSDFLNSGVQGYNDPFNEFYSGGTLQSLTAADKQQLDALGFHAFSPRQPDLSEYVSVSNTAAAPGASVTVDAYAMNVGNAISGASTAGIYLSTDSTITTSDTLLATVNSGTLATIGQPGYYDHQTLSVALPANLAPGTYYIGGIADYNNHVSESNESNNTYNVVPITVAAPDLSEYVSVSNTTVAPGASVTVDAYAMNVGNGISGASTAGIYLSTDSTITTSDTLLATVNSGTLATVGQPGYYDHQTLSVALPANLAPGTYYIGGIADYNNHVSESNEINNTYNAVQITVAAPTVGQPDLSEYVSVSNTTVAPGASVTVDAYAMNLGNGISGASTAGIYLSTDSTITTSDTLLATVNSGTLATVSQPGYYDHQTVSVALPANLAPGTYYIGGIADYNNHVSESNEINNTYNVVQMTVSAPAATAPQAMTNARTSVNELFGGGSASDAFVFGDNLVKGTIANNPQGLDHIQFDHTAVTTASDLGHGNALTGADVSNAQPPAADLLQHHLNDFHIV